RPGSRLARHRPDDAEGFCWNRVNGDERSRARAGGFVVRVAGREALMKAILTTTTAMFLAMAILGAQAKKTRARDADWMAPASAAAKTNPLANRPDAAAGGRRLFHERCSTCHGDSARGTSRGPDLTSSEVQAQTDGDLFWKITSGNTRTGMPT